MIWIIGEYAERIDNADELLENFLDGFHDENTQVFIFIINFFHVANINAILRALFAVINLFANENKTL